MVGFTVDDKLGDGVGVGVHAHGAGNLLVLHQRQEELDELGTVRWRDCLQHLCHEIPGIERLKLKIDACYHSGN